ncbi:MAG: efflux transporter periplasmic adaptor subunit [Planctomycetes bacterium]|nr:efflux transporter periplasmic adaptor subunit [Planctomycetota bacterium]
MTSPASGAAGRARRALLLLMCLALAGAAAVALGLPALLGASGRSGRGGERPTFRVARGPLQISVIENGSIQAREQLTIKSEVEGQTTLLFLTPEGTVVKKGDLLAQLDASKLEDERVEQQIRLQNAEAAFVRARETLAVARSQAESDVAAKVLDAQFAREDLKKYSEGDYPNQLKEAEAKIALAEAELKRATQKLEWSKILSAEKYLSSTELQADELAARKAGLDLELAQSARRLLEEFSHKRTLTSLEADQDQKGKALERTRRKAASDVTQAEADLKAKETEFQRQQSKLKKMEDQIAKTKIHAPRGGLVVYATSTQGGMRGGNTDPLGEGQTVRERQELIKLPTAELMTAEIKIHESKLDKVKTGFPVRIVVDALPGHAFTGRVAKIFPLPDAMNMWMNPDLKVYTTQIDVDPGEGGMRTGMSCQAEIQVAEYADAVYVPVQAVVRRGTRTVAFVQKRAGQEAEPREVEIGLDNNRMVHVLSGLVEGEEVLLAPPLDAGAVDAGGPQAAGGGAKPAGAAGTAAKGPPAGGGPPGGAPGAAEGAGPDAAAAGDGAAAGRRRYQDMTPEEREAMRKRMEEMTPEEREKMRQGRRGRRPREGDPSGGAGESPGGGGTGGGSGGGGGASGAEGSGS